MFLHRGSGQRLSVNEAWTRTTGAAPKLFCWMSGKSPSGELAMLPARCPFLSPTWPQVRRWWQRGGCPWW